MFGPFLGVGGGWDHRSRSSTVVSTPRARFQASLRSIFLVVGRPASTRRWWFSRPSAKSSSIVTHLSGGISVSTGSTAKMTTPRTPIVLDHPKSRGESNGAPAREVGVSCSRWVAFGSGADDRHHGGLSVRLARVGDFDPLFQSQRAISRDRGRVIVNTSVNVSLLGGG